MTIIKSEKGVIVTLLLSLIGLAVFFNAIGIWNLERSIRGPRHENKLLSNNHNHDHITEPEKPDLSGNNEPQQTPENDINTAVDPPVPEIIITVDDSDIEIFEDEDLGEEIDATESDKEIKKSRRFAFIDGGANIADASFELIMILGYTREERDREWLQLIEDFNILYRTPIGSRFHHLPIYRLRMFEFLRDFRIREEEYKNFEIYLFEPLPQFKPLFDHMIELGRKRGIKVVHMPYALSDEDGEATFFRYIEGRTADWGSSLYDYENGDYYTGKKKKHDKEKIEVKKLDFAKWMSENFEEEDVLFFKCDVEGEEYKILNELLRTDTSCFIDRYFVEWHDRFFEDTPEDENQKLMDEINTQCFEAGNGFYGWA